MNKGTSRFAAAFVATGMMLGMGLVTGGAVVGTTSAVLAQSQGGGAAGQGRRRMAEMMKQLGLSDAQKAHVRAIITDMHKKNASVDDPAAKRANFQAAMKQIHDNVFTPAQAKKADEMMKKYQQEHPSTH
jgi:hypothetical protein